MTYTPEQRRRKLEELVRQDTDASELEREFFAEQEKFNRLVDRLPGFLRKRLFGYPTLLWLYHQRVVTLMCEEMRFPE